MSLQFEDQNNLIIKRNPYSQNYGYITSLIFKFHLAKSEKSANRMLIIIASIAILLALVFAGYNIYKLNKPVKVKYNVSQDVFKKLPQNIQIKILTE